MRIVSETSEPPGGSGQTARLLLAVVPPLSRHLGRRLREQGAISVDRFKALHALSAGPLRSGELAGLVLLSPAAVTRLADGLVADQLARREDDPTDRRAVRIALTDAGRAELARGETIVTEALDEILDPLTPDERLRLELSLDDLRRVVDLATTPHGALLRERAG